MILDFNDDDSALQIIKNTGFCNQTARISVVFYRWQGFDFLVLGLPVVVKAFC